MATALSTARSGVGAVAAAVLLSGVASWPAGAAPVLPRPLDALLGQAPAPVTGLDGWRVARLLEWAAESSEKRCEIACDWSGEPEEQ